MVFSRGGKPSHAHWPIGTTAMGGQFVPGFFQANWILLGRGLRIERSKIMPCFDWKFRGTSRIYILYYIYIYYESVKEHLGRCARICAHDAQSVVQKGKASLASPG